MVRMGRIFGAALLLSTALFTASACQVALRAGDEDARCAPEKSVCAPGLTCQGGYCRPCTPKPEECNLVDDDCDGQIDEDFDQDGDGYKSCGVAGEIDCNDDPNRGGNAIHPGADELCNGYDDNCNGLADETPIDCTAEQECWSAQGKCTVKGDCNIYGCTVGGCNRDTGLCDDPDCRKGGKCAVGEFCDPKTGNCVATTEVGSACDLDSVCKSGSTCMDLGLAGITARSPRICSYACCEAAGCPSGFVCKMGSTGASLCLRAEDLGLTVGAKAAHEKCAAGKECRSGVCEGGACIDGCCGQPSCGAGGTCSFKSDGKFLCRDAVGSGGAGMLCLDDSDCATGFCYYTNLVSGVCGKRCCTSEDCPSGWQCWDWTVTGSSLILNACRQIPVGAKAGLKRAGEACAAGTECRSAQCVGGICYDSCCRDADCAGGTVCQPTKVAGGSVAPRCVKKS